jgi:endonuclease/exonuclease/phosphatase family metal-dependent hydrolase
MTYNVHGCQGRDRQWSPHRIADVIASAKPDIVALQELDAGRARSGGVDQAELIAAALGMRVQFHPAFRVMEERYGDAVLTACPSRLVKAGPLPGGRLRRLEPRGALWAAIEVDGLELQVITTHLGLLPGERHKQIDVLLGPDWLGHRDCRDPIVLLGDFNTGPRSHAYRKLTKHLHDAHKFHRRRGQPTFPARFPALRLDYAFIGPGVDVTRAETLRTPLARIASDHLPLVVDLDLQPSSFRLQAAQ